MVGGDAAANAKVLFRVPDEDGSANVETLWAVALGNDEYRLENSPFYAYSVSWGDIVYAPYSPTEERPTFQRVVKKSGNRTVRIIFEIPAKNGNPSDLILQEMVKMGCSYEGANPGFLSINIPPHVDLDAICQFLVAKRVQWEHADPSYSERHG